MIWLLTGEMVSGQIPRLAKRVRDVAIMETALMPEWLLGLVRELIEARERYRLLVRRRLFDRLEKCEFPMIEIDPYAFTLVSDPRNRLHC